MTYGQREFVNSRQARHDVYGIGARHATKAISVGIVEFSGSDTTGTHEQHQNDERFQTFAVYAARK